MSKLPKPSEFFRDTPILKPFELNEDNKLELIDIEYFHSRIDLYCVSCQSDSMFEGTDDTFSKNHSEHVSWDRDGIFHIELVCLRCNYRYYYSFLVENKKLLKLGQFPSLADVHVAKFKKYNKFWDKHLAFELSRSVGLFSHGVGIGSFIYLRRIFEKLIADAHQLAIEDNPNYNGNDFSNIRMEEKIKRLKDYLPKFLYEHRIIYGILSKGIHELSDDECLKYYTVILGGIEIILEEKMEESEKKNRLNKASKEISKINSELK